MANFIVAGIIVIIIALASIHIIREKKRGAKCIGCPAASECSKAKNGGCGCK